MATDSLSQSDIDLLFSRGGADAEPPEEERSDEVRLYDFQRPSRISKDRMRSLRAIYSVLTKGMEGWFAGRIRDTISMELEGVEQLTFGEFQLALPSPCAAYVLQASGPEPNQAVMEIGQEFAFFLVDRFLGGCGIPGIPDRSFTMVERGLVQLVAQRVAEQLSEAWQDYVTLNLQVTGFESIPDMLQVANPEDPVLAANVKVTVDNVSSPLLVCLPFGLLERFFSGTTNRRPQVARGDSEERRTERTLMQDHLLRAGIPVAARFPAIPLPLGELSELKPGAILSTGLSTDAELTLLVMNQPRFSGRAGKKGSHLAFRVEESLPGPEGGSPISR